MSNILLAGQWLLAHYMEVLYGLGSVVGGALVISLIIPGEHPDKELQWAADKVQWLVDILKKVSVKEIKMGEVEVSKKK